MRWLIALGGAAGAVGRVWVDQAMGVNSLPIETLAVNLTGVFALAWLLGATNNDRIRASIGTGFLGAWTTFSALAVEIDRGLMGRNDLRVSILYVVLTLGGGLLMLRLGQRLGASSRRSPQPENGGVR